MSSQIVTDAIVLGRREFGEADRILTVITPEHGKLGIVAKGVRRPKSKLAGGIELFSINELTILRGRGQLHTLTSSRVKAHYGNIVKSIDRTMLGYELIKQLNRITEDEAEAEYFFLCSGMIAGLDNSMIDARLLELWFWCRLLTISGYGLDLQRDTSNNALSVAQQYVFIHDRMAFEANPDGIFNSRHIKLLRLCSALPAPEKLSQVKNTVDLLDGTLKLLQSIARTHTS